MWGFYAVGMEPVELGLWRLMGERQMLNVECSMQNVELNVLSRFIQHSAFNTEDSTFVRSTVR
jgi:hypothetical protein